MILIGKSFCPMGTGFFCGGEYSGGEYMSYLLPHEIGLTFKSAADVAELLIPFFESRCYGDFILCQTE